MGAAHGHSHDSDIEVAASGRSTLLLGGISLALFVATIIGLIALWPSGSATAQTQLLAPGVVLHDATVTQLPGGEDTTVFAKGNSGAIEGVSIEVQTTPDVLDGMHEGDQIRVLAVTSSNETASIDGAAVYAYFDHQRTVPLGLLFVAYLLVVALVARGRGLRAVLGLAAGVAVVAWFLVPSLLEGANPTLVALVAAGAMIFPSVYIAHGVSVRTTTAVIGTCAGIGITLLIALIASGPAGMTGADDENAQHLFVTQPGVSLSGLFLTGVIVSSLGALNDVTITQASATWELRAAMPTASRWKVFAAAMRIGRDHIASTVYTLAYAYIGSALPILLVAATIDRGFLDTITSGEIGAEVFRTLVASIGLVLAIPLTTGIAAALASTRTPRPKFDAEQAVW